MKKHFILVLLACCVVGAVLAQNNPYESLGIETKVLTLSKGKYKEVFDDERIVQIGSVLFDIEEMRVISVINKDSIPEGFYDAPTSDSRWISPDPLAEEFTDYSPYVFGNDNPIRFNDPTGLAPEDCCGGDPPTAAGVLFEAYQNARAGLFNLQMQATELFGYSSSIAGKGYSTRMQVNYDAGGRISLANPVSYVTQAKKGALGEAGDAALNTLSLMPIAELGAAKGAMNAPFLAARVPSSSLSSLIPTEAGAQSRAAIDDIIERMNEGDLFIFDEPIHTVEFGGREFILDGHHRIEAAIESGHDLHVTTLSHDEAAELYPNKFQQISDGEFD